MVKTMSLPKRAVALFSAAIIAVSMVCAAPLSAMAAGDIPEASGYQGTIKATNQQATVAIGDTLNMSVNAEVKYFNLKDEVNPTLGHHVDYSVTETGDGGAATINKHSGVLTPSAAGTVTVTATLLDCATPSQVNSNPCYQERVLNSASKTVTITEAQAGDYGWQGNALQIKLADTYNVTVDQSSTDTAYVNNVANVDVADDGYLYIDYSQNYGTGNNFAQFLNNNAGKVTLTDENGTEVALGDEEFTIIQKDPSAKQDLTLQIAAEDLELSGECTLTFASDYVAGNGTSTLGATVSFVFTI